MNRTLLLPLFALGLQTVSGCTPQEQKNDDADEEVGVTTDGTVEQGLTITTDGDTYVRSGQFADESFGRSSQVRSDGDNGGTKMIGFLRILVGNVVFTRARLRLYVTNASRGGVDIVAVASTWTERGTTWNNKPAVDGRVVATLKTDDSGSWVYVDVTPAVTAGGVLSLAIVPRSDDGFAFASRETGNPPRLVLDTNGADAGPAPTCTAFTYSAFAPCQPNGTQTRAVISATPVGCTGGTPALEQVCTYVPPAATCTSFTYTAFGPCQPDNTQARMVASALPEGCSGGGPALSQSCTYVAPVITCTSFVYSAFGSCQPDNTQTRSVTSASPSGCSGGNPILSQSCTYVAPPAPSCMSFTYTEYGACQPDGRQTRTVTSSSPSGCTGGAPALSQACTYTPPGLRDYKTFDGSSLTANRNSGQPGADQRRVKPFSALESEYPRVLASTPASLGGAASTFGVPPTRWYEESQSSVVELKKSLDIAFDGCLTYTAAATKYATAPTSASATTECTAMARRFWSRTPAPDEVQACVTAATTATAAEPNARRKWAYACTAVLTSTGFLTY